MPILIPFASIVLNTNFFFANTDTICFHCVEYYFLTDASAYTTSLILIPIIPPSMFGSMAGVAQTESYYGYCCTDKSNIF